MFDHIFENRDKKVTNIIKLSDYLGRSLRENVEIFSINDTDSKVTFITEKGKIIAGQYDFDDGLYLKNIQIEEDDLFEDTEKFDDFVNYKISNFIQNLFEEDFVEADTSFNKVLQLWESRVKFSSVKEKLYEKSQKFNGSNRIIESDEFQKLVEITPNLIEFLKENTNIVNIPEINNMVRLSSSVSQAFNLPKITYEHLAESTYEIPETINHSVYDMICKQELIRKELVESKNNFDLVWLNNEKVSKLASLIHEEDAAVIAKMLVEAICEVPYLALATKKQITETITNNLELNSSVKVNLKDIKTFSSLIFEYKKPLKTLFISMLNEKYGISVQNLKDIPTFRSLLNTQVLIFEALAKLSPKGSVQKEVLQETGKMLKSRNGVESIDVNRYIELIFEKANYINIIAEEPLVDTISIKETFSEIESIEELVSLVLDRVQEADAPAGASPEPESHASARRANKGSDDAAAKKEVDRQKAQAKVDAARKAAKTAKRRTSGGGESPQYGAENAETAPEEEPRVDEQEPVEAPEPEVEAQEEEPPETEETEKKKEIPTSDEIMSSFKSFEDILNSINFDEIIGDSEEEDDVQEKEDEVDKEEEEEE